MAAFSQDLIGKMVSVEEAEIASFLIHLALSFQPCCGKSRIQTELTSGQAGVYPLKRNYMGSVFKCLDLILCCTSGWRRQERYL